jgi:peroxiredoxin
VAIRPDTLGKLKNSIEKNKINYTLYSDSSTNLIQKIGIVIQAPDRYNDMLIKYSNQSNSNVIPAPSVLL